MSESDHIRLANIIKTTHKTLREESKIWGSDKAWQRHCNDSAVLQDYASAMRDLALNYWEVNSLKSQKATSRINWTYQACKWYFDHIDTFRNKELRVCEKVLNLTKELPFTQCLNPPYEVLDVGSCYNPLEQFQGFFKVLAIDIAPADPKVLTCDFLSVPTGQSTIINEISVKQLKKNHFDMVLFSLLLEYFPDPVQRLNCCLKAYELLKNEGILVVITPDSNHVGSNSKIIKSWQYVLTQHGFIRVKYEKLTHLHCMLFRKAQFVEVASRWASVHKSQGFYDHLYIPQDLQKNST